MAAGLSVSADGLGAQRRREDDAAWRALGHVPDRHDWLDYPDGHVAQVPHERLVHQIAEFLEEEGPDVVVTFGPTASLVTRTTSPSAPPPTPPSTASAPRPARE